MLLIKNNPNFRVVDKFLWADLFELLCITSIDKEFSTGDYKDRLSLWRMEKMILTDGDGQAEALDDATPAGKDQFELFVEEVMKILVYRDFQYGSAYPFIVETNKIKLRKAIAFRNRLSLERHLYLYLLVSAHAKYLTSSTDQHRFRADFEVIGYYALKQCFPSWAEVRLFGTTSSADHLVRHYTGTLYQKCLSLSTHLAEEARPEGNFTPDATGDGGLDIIAWLPFKDGLNSQLIAFGQAKCSPKWAEAKNEISYDDRWSAYLLLNNKPDRFMLIPYCYRNAQGEWTSKDQVGIILIDRQRIIELIGFNKNTDYWRGLASGNQVRLLIKKSEPLV